MYQKLYGDEDFIEAIVLLAEMEHVKEEQNEEREVDENE